MNMRASSEDGCMVDVVDLYTSGLEPICVGSLNHLRREPTKSDAKAYGAHLVELRTTFCNCVSALQVYAVSGLTTDAFQELGQGWWRHLTSAKCPFAPLVPPTSSSEEYMLVRSQFHLYHSRPREEPSLVDKT